MHDSVVQVPEIPGADKQEDGNSCSESTPQSKSLPDTTLTTSSLVNGIDTLGMNTDVEENRNKAIIYVKYEDERQLDDIMSLVDRDLSEPYSIFTYRYFLHQWPNLCFIARAGGRTVGTIVGKAEHEHDKEPLSGYIAMLAVDTEYRKHGIGTALAMLAIKAMKDMGCDEVVLETEVTNTGALHLYQKLGFTRNVRLIKYYLNGVDAYRLKLWFR
ncbi:unnamed protein product [Choristocarpus tenellus]